MRKLTRGQICTTALILLAFATVSRMYFALHHFPQVTFRCSTFTSIDPIVGGILLAVVLRGRAPTWSARVRMVLFAIGLGGIVATGALFLIL